jgi:serine/threonine protein kinase
MFYLLMEYVEGENLRQVLKAKLHTPAEALAIIAPVCDALQCAHELGIVHRDIKPENLLIHRSGTVKIADFGIARIMDQESTPEETSGTQRPVTTAHTIAIGTPDYAAPEQLAAVPIDHRADIYSLGVVLYEMLTGERPGTGTVLPPSRRIKVTPAIDEMVLKALAKDPERRFKSAGEFHSRIQQAQSALARPRRRSRRAILCLSATAIVAAVLWWQPVRDGWQKSLSDLFQTYTTPSSVPPSIAEENLRRFEENLTALLEARQQAFMQTPSGGTTPENLAAEIARLEKRDQELRELILASDNPPPATTTPPKETTTNP